MNLLAADIANALLHSVWQIGLIALAYAFVLAYARSAQVRYLLGCCALVLSLAIPLGWLLFTSEWMATTSAQSWAVPRRPSASGDGEQLSLHHPVIANSSHARQRMGIEERGFRRLEATIAVHSYSGAHPRTAWLTVVWLVGVCVVGMRIPLGFRSASRLKLSSHPVPYVVLKLSEKQCRQLALRCSVLVAQSGQVLVPCVTGILRPTVLLPASLVTGLTMAEIEAILAHELAHVRRHDFVVNLFQSVIESLLFYHPAVWWISRSVRHERENCCDDLALTICRDRKVYASALLTLGEVTPSVAVAANGGALFKRVTRILGHASPNSGIRSAYVFSCGAVVLLFAIAAIACHKAEESAESRSPETKAQSMDEPNKQPLPVPVISGFQPAERNARSSPPMLMTPLDHALIRLGVATIDHTFQPKGHEGCAQAKFIPFRKPFPPDQLANVRLIITNRTNPQIVGSATIGELGGQQGFVLKACNAMPVSADRGDVGTQPDVAENVSFSWMAVLQTDSPQTKSVDIRFGVLPAREYAAWESYTYRDTGELFADDPLGDANAERFVFLATTNEGMHGELAVINSAASTATSRGIENLVGCQTTRVAGQVALYWMVVTPRAGEQKSQLVIHTARAKPENFVQEGTRGDWRHRWMGFLCPFRKPPCVFVTSNSHEVDEHHSYIVPMAFNSNLGHFAFKGRSFDSGNGQSNFDSIAVGYCDVPLEDLADARRKGERILEPWEQFIEATNNGDAETVCELAETGKIGINEFGGEGGSLLTYCAYTGNVDLAKRLIAIGADVNQRHPYHHTTPLHTAAAFGQQRMVEFLLDRGANPNVATAPGTESQAFYSPHKGETPLHLAVKQANVEVADTLLKAGAHLHTKDSDGKLPIDYLKEDADRADEIRKLVDNRVVYLNRWQISDWQRAIENDDIDKVRELLEESQRRCVKCLQKFRQDGTWYLVDPLCEAARRNCVPVVKAMLEHKRLPNYTVGLGQYNGEIKGAHCLAWAGSEEMRQLLIDGGADPHTIDGIEIPNINEASIPLEQTTNDLGLQWQLAVEARDENRIRELLAKHPHLSRQVIMERWRDGRMGHRSLDPLYQMAQSAHLDMVQLMIEKGYDKSKLVGAVELAAPEVAAYLVDELRVEARPDVGLMAYIGDTESLKFWLDRGHKPEGHMLLDACGNRGRFRGHKFDAHTGWPEKFRETVRVLIEAGVDVNARMPSGNEKYDGCKPWRANGETPLHFSAGNWDPVQIQMLLDAGADKTLKNDLGETPYDWAVKFGAPEEAKEKLMLDDRHSSNLNRWRTHEWYRAVESSDVETVARLLKESRSYRRKNIQKFRKDGTWFSLDPLCEAARLDCIPIAKMILESGRKPNITIGQGAYNASVPRAFCLAWATSDEMRNFLIENGADPETIEGIDVPNVSDETVPLAATTNDLGLQWQLAVESGDEDRVRHLLLAHPHLSRQLIKDRDRDGTFEYRDLDPMHRFASSEEPGLVKLMIEKGYDKSKLSVATEMATPKVAEYLLELGVEARPEVGELAYLAGHEAIDFWLKRGHKIEVPTLHNACCGRGRMRGHKQDENEAWPEAYRETVRVLIKHGADVNARMPSGNVRYDGCKPWVSNRETPLHFAGANHDPELVQMLLDAGADKTLKTTSAKRPTTGP